MGNDVATRRNEALTIFTPSNLEEGVKLAQYISRSQLCPMEFRGKEADVLVAMMWSNELGVTIMQGIQNIAVINGKPSIYGDLAVGLVWASGLCEDFKEYIEGKGDERVAFCTSKRKGTKSEQTRTFSVADAKAAGLWHKKGPWTQYPNRMLQMRARGFLLRDLYADVMKGLITREEAQDYPTSRKVKDVTPAPEPKIEPKAVEAETVKPVTEIKNFRDVEPTPEPQPEPEPTPEPEEPKAEPKPEPETPKENAKTEQMRLAVTKRRRYGWSVKRIEQLYGKKFAELSNKELKEIASYLKSCGTDTAAVEGFLSGGETPEPETGSEPEPDVPDKSIDFMLAELERLMDAAERAGFDVQDDLGIPGNWDEMKYKLSESILQDLIDSIKDVLA